MGFGEACYWVVHWSAFSRSTHKFQISDQYKLKNKLKNKRGRPPQAGVLFGLGSVARGIRTAADEVPTNHRFVKHRGLSECHICDVFETRGPIIKTTFGDLMPLENRLYRFILIFLLCMA